MSGLRPSVRMVAPDGREWELYAYRVRPQLEEGRFRRIRRLFAPRVPEWTVQAVSWAPYPIDIRWTTSSELRGHVLAQVEGQLARGDHPMPRNAKLVL
ncbi:MAG: hypothetical protein JOY72_00335 [Actinobacteria bacterium]|nr:hypothetical protein [Actinomycetota bacterium]